MKVVYFLKLQILVFFRSFVLDCTMHNQTWCFKIRIGLVQENNVGWAECHIMQADLYERYVRSLSTLSLYSEFHEILIN